MAEHIVKPIQDDGVSAVHWWVDKQQQGDNANTIENKNKNLIDDEGKFSH